MKKLILGISLLLAFVCVAAAELKIKNHPLDGLSAEEYQQITSILRDEGYANEKSLYPLIELFEPEKASVKSWEKGKVLDRKAIVQLKTIKEYKLALVNITTKKVEKIEPINSETMVLFAEFVSAMEITLSDERFIKALAKRNLTPDSVFCLPLTAGNFFTEEEKGKRLMNTPCYVKPIGSNYYAKPIEGLFATVDLKQGKLLEIVDEGVVTTPTDNWGYTEKEVAKRATLRKHYDATELVQKNGPNYIINGTEIEWDIWKFRYRIDKRPGMVVSDIKVNDGKDWRSLIYQTHLSEVFVPYMDPGKGWYWRTYMDSGEYGFGLFLTPLRKGVDCPAYATFMPITIHDDNGNPLVIPDAVCIFERTTGDPAWRHFEIFAQEPDNFVPTEGRSESELVVRTASQVGNYDYLVDYRFKQNGELYIKVGASGLDAVKGVDAKSLDDPSAAKDTEHGSLIAPNLVAANHDHYFNFKIDMDIDGEKNTATTANIVPHKVNDDALRRSMWKVEHKVVNSEMDGRFKLSAMKPRFFHMMNTNKKGYLGHTPAYMLHHGSVAYGPYDFENDPPMVRNGYIEYSIWNTLYDSKQRYAGGNFAFASDGNDTLAQWVKADRNLVNQDIVTWFTAGFHHIPRMEDWPVMSTEWKTIHLIPMNFFPHNPSLTLREPKNK
jgi:primary-amine oxidase